MVSDQTGIDRQTIKPEESQKNQSHLHLPLKLIYINLHINKKNI